MNEGYYPQEEKWVGRVDSDKKEHLRWHQVVEYIDLNSLNNKHNGFCIIGFMSDLGVEKNKGRKGAFSAPVEIRKQLVSLPWHFYDTKLFDAGNVVCINNLEKSQELLADKVKTILSCGMFPIIIGGGHEVALGSILGIDKFYDDMPTVVNFDAHFDLRDYKDGHTSGTSFSKAADIAKQNGKRFDYMCLGIQKSGNTQYLFDKANSIGAHWILADDMVFSKEKSVSILKNFIKDKDRMHITICMDVFRADIACGVSAPQPFGITTETFLEYFNILLKHKKIAGFDIAEVSPVLDIDNRTSRLAAQIIFRLVEGLYRKSNTI